MHKGACSIAHCNLEEGRPIVYDYAIVAPRCLLAARGLAGVDDRMKHLQTLLGMSMADLWVHESPRDLCPADAMTLGMALGAMSSLRLQQTQKPAKVVVLTEPWGRGVLARSKSLANSAEWKRPWRGDSGVRLALYLAATYYYFGDRRRST